MSAGGTCLRYKKRARQTFGKQDKIVWRLFCFKFCMGIRASDKFQSANLHAILFPAQTLINYRQPEQTSHPSLPLYHTALYSQIEDTLIRKPFGNYSLQRDNRRTNRKIIFSFTMHPFN